MQHYTLGQIELFADAVAVARKAAMRDNLLAARGAQADKNGFNKILKELD